MRARAREREAERERQNDGEEESVEGGSGGGREWWREGRGRHGRRERRHRDCYAQKALHFDRMQILHF